MVKKKSSNPLGSGTIIIRSIEKTNITTPISVISLKNLSDFFTLFTSLVPYKICKSILI
ncbi:hypothetical protein CMTB2_01723 [Caminibacter mediatlanticus TB-2]|uniref:Uncharacterized protein n=1 Tax=Caminibacter mediatlanticus TB-2 TaxID=391592 RepID=A0AAI9AIM4_9BACT|nr:hypothetical protein CMTB2_01723 [Caminibacter mediatlanticus TB-2]